MSPRPVLTARPAPAVPAVSPRSWARRVAAAIAPARWRVGGVGLRPPALSSLLAPPAPRAPESWLARRVLLTIYGRAFGVAPILGRLGMDDSFAAMDWQIQPFAHGIKDNDGGTDPIIGVHLIYGMATSCGGGNCLFYLDDAGVDIVKDYILPAARRHWLVVLDDQLGRSDPVSEVQRLIDRGYLAYDNVEIALDPEFRATPDQYTPGIPVGSVTADELNRAQELVNRYCAARHLVHRKVMMVHQFQSGMIVGRETLRGDLPYVDPVIVADGFGAPGLKAHVYGDLMGPGASSGVTWRGVKLFYPNPYENAGHFDDPLLTWPQVFGKDGAVDADGHSYYLRPGPRVIVIA